MRVSARFVFIILCCILAHYHAADAKAQYVNTRIIEKKVTIRSAVILPAKVEITKESAKGAEMMVAESADISAKVDGRCWANTPTKENQRSGEFF